MALDTVHFPRDIRAEGLLLLLKTGLFEEFFCRQICTIARGIFERFQDANGCCSGGIWGAMGS